MEMVQNIFDYESESCSLVSDSLWSHGLYSPWNSPGQNIGVGSLYLLQWVFPTQELNLGLLHCRRILYQLSYEGSNFDYKESLFDVFTLGLSFSSLSSVFLKTIFFKKRMWMWILSPCQIIHMVWEPSAFTSLDLLSETLVFHSCLWKAWTLPGMLLHSIMFV